MKPMYYLPLKFLLLTSAFGYRIHPVTGQYKMHNGIDLRADYDTVYSITDGQANLGNNRLLGIYMTVTDSVLTVTYGHLSQILAFHSVRAGQPIAITGATGRVTGPHLHLSINFKGQAVDPIQFLYQLIQQEHE